MHWYYETFISGRLSSCWCASFLSQHRSTFFFLPSPPDLAMQSREVKREWGVLLLLLLHCKRPTLWTVGCPVLKALYFYGHNSEKLVSDLGQNKQFLVLWCRKKHINSECFFNYAWGLDDLSRCSRLREIAEESQPLVYFQDIFADSEVHHHSKTGQRQEQKTEEIVRLLLCTLCPRQWQSEGKTAGVSCSGLSPAALKLLHSVLCSSGQSWPASVDDCREQ